MVFIQKKAEIKKKEKIIILLPYSKFQIDYGMRLRVFYQRRNLSGQLDGPIVPYRKVIDGILYVLRTGCQWKMLPKEYGSNSTCHRRFQKWNSADIFKKVWIKLLKTYDDCIGINWTWQSIDSISVKSPLGGR